jgi:hypothetical protein
VLACAAVLLAGCGGAAAARHHAAKSGQLRRLRVLPDMTLAEVLGLVRERAPR